MIGGNTKAVDVSQYLDTLKLKSFMGAAVAGASAGNRSMTQLWNPAASGKLLICSNAFIFVNQATSTNVVIAHHNAALTTAGLQGNKYLAGAAPVGQCRQQNPAALLGTSIVDYRIIGNDHDIHFFPNVIVPEGLGLCISYAGVEMQFIVMYQWTEIDV